MSSGARALKADGTAQAKAWDKGGSGAHSWCLEDKGRGFAEEAGSR